MIDYEVRINYADRSIYVRGDIDPIPQIDTSDDYSARCTPVSFAVSDAIAPEKGQEVEIIREGVHVFSGYIHNIQRDRTTEVYILECYSIIYLMDTVAFEPLRLQQYLAAEVAGFGFSTAVAGLGADFLETGHGLSVNDIVVFYDTDGRFILSYYYYVVRTVPDANKFTVAITSTAPSTEIDPVFSGNTFKYGKCTPTANFNPMVFALGSHYGFNDFSLAGLLEYMFAGGAPGGITIDTSDFPSIPFENVRKIGLGAPYYLSECAFDDRMLIALNQTNKQYRITTDGGTFDSQNYITYFDLLKELTSIFNLQLYPTGLRAFKITRLSSGYDKTTFYGLDEKNELKKGTDSGIYTPEEGQFNELYVGLRDEYDARNIADSSAFTSSHEGISLLNNFIVWGNTAIYNSIPNALYFYSVVDVPQSSKSSITTKGYLHQKIVEFSQDKSRVKTITPVDLVPKTCFNCFINQSLKDDTMEIEEITYS
jgi:hypothetical protein